MAPLLDIICEDHQEFVVEPFVDATVTAAEQYVSDRASEPVTDGGPEPDTD